MKCPACQEEGVTSVVYEGLTSTTDAYYPPFYDEDGFRHHHDGNARTLSLQCSRGHSWAVPQPPPLCETCGEWWSKPATQGDKR